MCTWNPLKLIGGRSRGAHAGPAALATCRSLVQLLAALQQHRGMSAAWLAGDKAFLGRMQQRRQEIDALIPGLRPGFLMETAESCPCFTMNDWKLFQFKWRDLVDRLAGATPQENIERHNHLIACLLEWLAALGESRLQLPAGGRLPAGVVGNFASRLPALAECLGQARALGSSVAAKGGCSPVARVRLGFLIARAESLLDRAGEAERGASGLHATQGLVLALSAMVRNELLASSGVRINSERYFATASQAIDAVFAWIDRSAAEVERALQNGAARPGSDEALLLAAFG